MQVVRGSLQGPLCVTAELEVHGDVGGRVTVAPGAGFTMHGICGGDVIVEAGARADLWGIVEGDIVNRGGAIRIFGMVNGRVHRTAGTTSLSADSRVKQGFAGR